MDSFSRDDLGRFLAAAVHGLRSSLARIYCSGEELRDGYGDRLDENGRFFVRSVCEGSEELEERLAILARLGQVYECDATMRVFDPAPVVAEVVAETAGSKASSISVAVAGYLWADERLVKDALAALVENAVRFTAPVAEPAIEIALTLGDGCVNLSVRDNGVGFDPLAAGRLFMPFSRLHRREGLSGKGEGLALVKAVAAVHGGRVKAEGEVGKGAVFSLILPVQK